MQFNQKNGFISSWVSEGSGKKIVFLPGWAETHSVWQESCPKNLLGYEKIFMNLCGHFPSEFPKDKNHLQLEEFLDSHFESLSRESRKKYFSRIFSGRATWWNCKYHGKSSALESDFSH